MMKPSKNKVAGGKRAAALMKARDPSFYKRIGRMGGLAPKTKPTGYALDRELASRSGKIGGSISKRRPSRV